VEKVVEVVKEVPVVKEVEKVVVKEVEKVVVKEVPAMEEVAKPVAATIDPRVQMVLDELGISLSVPGPADTEPRYGGSVSLRMVEPTTWDVHKYNSYRIRIGNSYMTERLLRWDHGPGKPPASYTPIPALAESWDVMEGGTKFVFNLRDGVKFHNRDPVNGREFVASDVVWTLDRINREDQAVRQKEFLKQVVSYEAPDDDTVVMELSEPVAAFLHFMTYTLMEILPHEAEEKCGDFAIPECSAVGTGPFMFNELRPGVSVKFERNPDYWERPYPYLDEVVQLFFGDERSEDAAFRTGKVDLLGVETCGISGERYRAFTKSNPDMIYPSFADSLNRRGLHFKSDAPPFDDVRVRRAAAMAIDRKGWVNSVLGGYGLPFGGYLSYGTEFWLPDDEYGEAAQYIQYNPEAAKMLLEEAGYGPGDIKITMPHTASYGERYASEGELMAGLLKDIGIEASLEMRDYDSFVPVWRDGNYENAVYTWLATGFLPEQWFVLPFHPEQRGKKAYGIDDPWMVEKLNELTGSLDSQERIDLSHELTKHIADQAYVVPAPWWIYFYAQNPRVKNYTYHDSFDNGAPLTKTWVEE
jgi:peptide/nickel transport system substrate-binding protein